jgi:lysophospholipase L1-like esterase
MSVTLYTPDLSKIIHETKVDFRQRVIQPIIHIVQYDKSLPIIAVKLYNNGIAYALPENADVSVRWGKRDHTFVYNAVLGCNSDRTIVYFEITEQMTVFYGEHNPIIELRNGTSLAGSGYIQFYLDRNPIQDGDVESHIELGVLENAIEQSQQAAAEALTDADRAALAAGQLVETVADVRDEMDSKLDKKPDGTNNLINVNGKLSSPYIPDYILNVQQIMGEFKSSLPIATIAGQYWIFTGTDGTVIGSYTWHLGDYAIWDGSTFIHLDNTTAVRSVNGKTGAVVLDGSDIKVKAGVNDAKLDVVVQELSDEVLTPTYEEVLHEDLISEITATNNVEIIDDAGVLIKVEGNEPTNLIPNSDLSQANTFWTEWKAEGIPTITWHDGKVTLATTDGSYGVGITKNNFLTVGNKYYIRLDTIIRKGNIRLPYFNPALEIATSGTYSIVSNAISVLLQISRWTGSSSSEHDFDLDNIFLFNITEMISKGVKNDAGILFSELSDAEIKEQMDIWVTNGFPTVINKIISKSDNLFDSEFHDLTDLESENLIPNSDLLIPKASPNENQPLGFTYNNATDITLSNGIAKFTATSLYGQLFKNFSGNNNKFYVFGSVKANSNLVRLTANTAGAVSHSGSGNFEYLSTIQIIPDNNSLFVADFRTSNFTPIEVDYMGAINITDLVTRGILPSGLTDAQYKAILDSACNRSKTPMVNVPLRETSLISVEPSTTYKLIKASANTPVHKVIEYATDGQVVKVSVLTYTDHKATFTTQSQTTKIKLVSDLMNRVPNLVNNSEFNESDLSFWKSGNSTKTVVNGVAVITGNIESTYMAMAHDFTPQIPLTDLLYVSYKVRTTSANVTSINTGVSGFSVPALTISNPVQNTWYVRSGISSTRTSVQRFIVMTYAPNTNGVVTEADYVNIYNMTTFKNAGVVNDTGTLFSRLTNDEIKEQMDIWVQNGFPDHVMHALYPNGVDSAIAIKYNDADDIFHPQQIDELPLDITLRSGEYWQGGYIVKQNGNTEYYPLSTTFSAWNYGQLKVVYDSGIPADFTIKFVQNTKAQVQTNSDYLIEARERLDTLRINQELLIEKLGVDVEADDYDSFVGITSAEYEYFGLEGIKEGDKLNIDAYGQGVLNLLPNTITASQTAFGLTITYDNTTGIVTVNGTSTGANNFILKTGMVLGKPQGTTVQLMRYFVSGTANLNGSYMGYVLAGTSVSNRINENSESLYDPYINASGGLKASGALSGVAGTSGQTILFQVFASGMVFTDFKFKLGVFEGLTLQPFVMPSLSNSTAVDVCNKTANKLNTVYTTTPSAVSGITVTYDALSQEYIFDGTASGANSITLSTNLFSVKSGDRLSIKRLYQSGDITPVSALPIITLISGSTTIVSNSIYKMTAPEGQTPTPDVTFNTGTASADLTNITLKLTFASGDVFNSYRCRIMIHDKSSDIGYVGYSSTKIGSISLEAGARGKLSFTAIDFGILSFVPQTDKLNVVFGASLTDLSKTNLEYNAGIQSPNRRISELNERLSNVDNPFRDKVIAIWGDSRESNNPTSDPQGVGDQLDTSYPSLLAKKLGATVLNFGLSGGCWAENTTQQDASSAIVNRVQTQDVSASADVILISSMNDYKLATTLGSPLPANKDKTTFYGAMRVTYDRLAVKYPAKKIWLVLPQKRFDEATNYGGGDYLSYRKAQIEVAKEYGIPTIDLYNNFANGGGGTVPTFPTTTMLNATHFTAIGNDMVAELITRALIGNGNGGSVDIIPPIPQVNGTYVLKCVVLNGVHTFSWIIG